MGRSPSRVPQFIKFTPGSCTLVLGVHRADHRQLVGDPGEVRQEFGNDGAGLAVRAEGVGRTFEVRNAADQGELLVIFQQLLGDGFAVELVELWLGVEEVECDGPPAMKRKMTRCASPCDASPAGCPGRRGVCRSAARQAPHEPMPPAERPRNARRVRVAEPFVFIVFNLCIIREKSRSSKRASRSRPSNRFIQVQQHGGNALPDHHFRGLRLSVLGLLLVNKTPETSPARPRRAGVPGRGGRRDRGAHHHLSPPR